jgi:DNA-directed RNA polymerase specialized sigma24 family protein
MQVDEILQALEAFPDPEYTAFVMRRIQGYSYSEIGQLFGWSNQRTTDVVHQTWRRLQRLLGIERL